MSQQEKKQSTWSSRSMALWATATIGAYGSVLLVGLYMFDQFSLRRPHYMTNTWITIQMAVIASVFLTGLLMYSGFSRLPDDRNRTRGIGREVIRLGVILVVALFFFTIQSFMNPLLSSR